MTGIKICGLTREMDLQAALDAGADRVGFILAPGSPRTVTVAKAAELAQMARGTAAVVVVMVNPSDLDLLEVTRSVGADFLQLHGAESPQRVAEVREQYHLPVIKALGIADVRDIHKALAFSSTVDELLLDSKPPKDARRTGGFGHVFDWSLIRNARFRTPWMLAGGLNPDNVADAMVATNAPFVDVSTGVESAPGLKDPQKIKAFVENVRAVP